MARLPAAIAGRAFFCLFLVGCLVEDGVLQTDDVLLEPQDKGDPVPECLRGLHISGATLCTSNGELGLCRGVRGGPLQCCTGCWNGYSCQTGSLHTACGDLGKACASCSANGDFCMEGVCADSCDDGNECTSDYESFVCASVVTPLASCGSDGGQCSPQGECVVCDDGNECTEDSYNGSVCLFTPSSDNTCGDVVYGFANGHCLDGACLSCDDGNVCTHDSFDFVANECVHVFYAHTVWCTTELGEAGRCNGLDGSCCAGCITEGSQCVAACPNNLSCNNHVCGS